MATSKAKPFPSRLLVRPAPLKGEGLRGYLLRVGERNGCGEGMNLFRMLTGYNNNQYMVSDQALDNIAQSLDLSRDVVETISYRPVANDVASQCLFFGHRVSVNHLRSQHPAVCPDCLAQQQAISGLWDLRAVCVCPHHGKWLVDLCPACGQSLKWHRSRVANCQCGFDLRSVETQAAPPDALVLTTLIHEVVLNDLPTSAERSLDYPEEVRQIPLNELLALFRYTAEVLVSGHAVGQEVRVDGTETFSKHSQAAVLMARFLKAWPDELSLVLAGLASFHDVGTDIPAFLSAKQFNARYRRVLDPALDLRSLCLKVPEFFKRALQQFRDEHCISSTGEGRYLNPALVWRASDGQRVSTFIEQGRRDTVKRLPVFAACVVFQVPSRLFRIDFAKADRASGLGARKQHSTTVAKPAYGRNIAGEIEVGFLVGQGIFRQHKAGPVIVKAADQNFRVPQRRERFGRADGSIDRIYLDGGVNQGDGPLCDLNLGGPGDRVVMARQNVTIQIGTAQLLVVYQCELPNAGKSRLLDNVLSQSAAPNDGEVALTELFLAVFAEETDVSIKPVHSPSSRSLSW